MNTHKNARLTFARRLEMVHNITQRGLCPGAAAMAEGVSVPTVKKWSGRYLAHGKPGLCDRSSRPRLSPRAIAPGKALDIVELRRHRDRNGVPKQELATAKHDIGKFRRDNSRLREESELLNKAAIILFLKVEAALAQLVHSNATLPRNLGLGLVAAANRSASTSKSRV